MQKRVLPQIATIFFVLYHYRHMIIMTLNYDCFFTGHFDFDTVEKVETKRSKKRQI